jgi:hypothetical protein
MGNTNQMFFWSNVLTVIAIPVGALLGWGDVSDALDGLDAAVDDWADRGADLLTEGNAFDAEERELVNKIQSEFPESRVFENYFEDTLDYARDNNKALFDWNVYMDDNMVLGLTPHEIAEAIGDTSLPDEIADNLSPDELSTYNDMDKSAAIYDTLLSNRGELAATGRAETAQALYELEKARGDAYFNASAGGLLGLTTGNVLGAVLPDNSVNSEAMSHEGVVNPSQSLAQAR